MIPVLYIAINAVIQTARAEVPTVCPVDRMAGQIYWQGGAKKTVSISHGKTGKPGDVALPACFLYGDHLEVGSKMDVTVQLASEQKHIKTDESSWTWDVPLAAGGPEGSSWAFFATLLHAATGSTRSLSLYAASRAASACPPAGAQPPPLAPVSRLRETGQQIGADLRALVAMWQASPEPRLVRAKLLRQDGSVLVQNSTCHGSSVPLLLRANDLHPGDRLTMTLTDTQGGALHYDITVVEPGSLPQPPVPVEEDWLAATWRLTTLGPNAQLDSIARVAKASESSFGAQRILGAIATDEAF